MGTDKALCRLAGETLLERGVSVLRQAATRVALASGALPRYESFGIEELSDRFEGAGPLAGLEAALAACGGGGNGWVAILACDMPRARADVFAFLRSFADEQGLDACLLRTSKGPEPLFGVYHKNCLPALQRALRAGQRRMICFHQGFGSVNVGFQSVHALAPHLGTLDCTQNVNTRLDLELEETRA